MCFAMRRVFFIKDLKDLDNGTARFSIDIKDLKDLKRHRLTMELAGAWPPRYGHIETRRSLLPRRHQDPAGSPTPGGLSYRTDRNMKHPHIP